MLGWLELGRELCWGQGLGLEFLAFTVSRACRGVVFGGKWGIAPFFGVVDLSKWSLCTWDGSKVEEFACPKGKRPSKFPI